MANKISVVLPTYNEKDNIGPLISRIESNLRDYVHEIVVVDDDSPDGTWKVVEQVAEKGNNNVRLLRRQGKTGLTSAISDGIHAAEGDVVVWMDTDLSMPPEKIPELLEEIDQGYDMAVGSRYVPGGGMVIIEKSQDSMLAALLSFCMNYAIQKILDASFKDYTSGFIAVRKEVLDNIKLRGDYGEYFIDLAYRAIKKGYKLTEIPYISTAREYGTSKTGTNLPQYIKRGWKYIWTTLSLRFSSLK
jgi:dolichol-phosphate mannosyltransferase